MRVPLQSSLNKLRQDETSSTILLSPSYSLNQINMDTSNQVDRVGASNNMPDIQR